MDEPQNYQLLRDMAIDLSKDNPISYLEIGTREGGSANAILNHPPLLSRIYLAVLVDTWGDTYGGTGRGSPEHVLVLLGSAAKRCLIISGDSKAVLPTLSHSFDFIFVDGDHSAEGCQIDMENSLRLLSPKGVMLVDDIDNEQHTYLRELVARFASKHGLKFNTHAVHAGVAELRR